MLDARLRRSARRYVGGRSEGGSCYVARDTSRFRKERWLALVRSDVPSSLPFPKKCRKAWAEASDDESEGGLAPADLLSSGRVDQVADLAVREWNRPRASWFAGRAFAEAAFDR